jgi:thiol:disulfide interchange protein DsbA
MIRQLALSTVLALALCACSSRQTPAPRGAAASASAGSPAASASGPGATGASGASPSAAPGPASSAAAANSPLALPASSKWRPGVNYVVVSPAQPTNAPRGKVQVMEVFWLACPHCYALEPQLEAWRKKMPSYVQFVRVPVMWGPVQRAHARLYYALEALGRHDLIDTAFQYIHGLEMRTGSESILVGSSRANTLRIQQAFAAKYGVAPSAFADAYNSFDVSTRLQQAEEIEQTYEINSVPTIIVDGRYRTNPAKAGGERQLIQLIDFLAKWDHDHQSEG